MNRFKDIEEASLLSKQATTDSRADVFDASQFRSQVGQDVPLAVVVQLQAEFGNDMAGAIDKFHTEEVKSSKTATTVPSQDKNELKVDESRDDDATSDSLGRQDFVVRDRLYRREYVMKNPTISKTSRKKHKKCIVFIQRDYAEDLITLTTTLFIIGPILRNALRNVFRGAKDFGLTDNDSSEMHPYFMFWARPELELLLKYYKSIKNITAIFEINAALRLIQSEHKEMISMLSTLLPHSITFRYVWALLPPECLMVGRNDLYFESIWAVRSCGYETIEGREYLIIHAECLVWDGSKPMYAEEVLSIAEFKGMKQIGDLPYIPLKYHPRRGTVIKDIGERSAKALKFWRSDFQYREHSGPGLIEVNKEVEQYPFSGRIVIDPDMMRQVLPSNKIMPSKRRMTALRTASRACITDFTTGEEEPDILQLLLQDASKVPGANTNGTSSRERSCVSFYRSDSTDIFTSFEDSDDDRKRLSASLQSQEAWSLIDVQSCPQQFLIISGLLYGYSFGDGIWGAFAVDRVSNIQWRSTIFDSLVMDQARKDLIRRLVVSHNNSASAFDDFVLGKGKGLIALLFGPPGTGKTLTAEAIAEVAQVPLYAVSSGRLGHQASKIELTLTKILRLAKHWKTVLLLDEADVFLVQRTITDIERNAVVSVFLRELEYYQGILLLTTNQAHVIDEAFQSRIHIFLQYQSLDTAARLEIWQKLMVNAQDDQHMTVNVEEEDLRRLAQIQLNGRQIKNTMSVTVKLASTSEERIITMPKIIDTMSLLEAADLQRQSRNQGPGLESRSANLVEADGSGHGRRKKLASLLTAVNPTLSHVRVFPIPAPVLFGLLGGGLGSLIMVWLHRK